MFNIECLPVSLLLARLYTQGLNAVCPCRYLLTAPFSVLHAYLPCRVCTLQKNVSSFGPLGCLAPLDPKALRRQDFCYRSRGKLQTKGCARLMRTRVYLLPLCLNVHVRGECCARFFFGVPVFTCYLPLALPKPSRPW